MSANIPTVASIFVDVLGMPWEEPFPGVRFKVLHMDKETKEATILFETRPGTVIPEHIHGGIEWAFMLEGTLEDDEGVCSAGNFVVRPAGSRHEPCTPTGARYIGLFHGAATAVATGRLFPNYGD